MQLTPFTKLPFDLKFTGKVNRTNGDIFFKFSLFGTDLNKVLIDDVCIESNAERKDNLWQSTCFEVFLMPDGQSNYWEVNASPKGDWNIYSFLHYRKDMAIEKKINNIDIKTIKKQDQFQIEFSLKEESLVDDSRSWIIGLSAVLCVNGENTYWAMTHQNDVLDFHREENFLGRLD